MKQCTIFSLVRSGAHIVTLSIDYRDTLARNIRRTAVDNRRTLLIELSKKRVNVIEHAGRFISCLLPNCSSY